MFEQLENYLVAVIEFGSRRRDWDLLIVLEGEEFGTPKDCYELVAEVVRENPRIDVQIRSFSEFRPDNYVTFTLEFLQHLTNAGKVIEGDERILGAISSMYNSLKNDPKSWYAEVLSFGLANRKAYLNQLLDKPAKYNQQLWRGAICRVFEVEPIGENIKGILETFYAQLNKLQFVEETLQAIRTEDYQKLAGIVERDAWLVNEYVKNQI